MIRRKLRLEGGMRYGPGVLVLLRGGSEGCQGGHSLLEGCGCRSCVVSDTTGDG